jgi:hypothetical protein
MQRLTPRLTAAEWIALLAIVAIVLVLGVGAMNVDTASDLCKFRGGVPIADRNGDLIRCDFPTVIHRF